MIETIFHYFPLLNPLQQEQLRQMQAYYEWWNARVNLISRKDMEHFYVRHVLHSLSIASFIRFPDNSTVMDAGTGGGFPGIPLAIAFPNAHFHLVDSIGKKTNAAAQICQSLDIRNVSIECNRIEKIRESFDYMVSRAVAMLNSMIHWTGRNINHQKLINPKPGIFYLKGGDISAELEQVSWNHTVYPLNKIFSEPYFETKLLVHLYKASDRS